MMISINLTATASMYGKPCSFDRWVRTITVAAAATAHTAIRRPTFSAGLCVGKRKVPVAWRIASCAPLGPPAHDKVLYRKLGFRGQKCLFSSEDKGGVLGGERGGSAASTSSMRSVNRDDKWFESDLSPATNFPSQNHHDHNRQKPPPPQQQQSTKLLTLPTILTIGRVAAVPLLVSTFFVNGGWGPNVTTGIFIVAAITDWLDGYIARKMKLGTAFGAFLDPVADKLMVAATLVLLCTKPLEVPMFGQVPWLLTVPSIAIIGREITMSAVREWAASQNSKLSEAVAVNNLGKWKTATQMISLTMLLAARDSSLAGAGVLVASGVILLYISAWLAVWSLVVYMRKIWKVLLM